MYEESKTLKKIKILVVFVLVIIIIIFAVLFAKIKDSIDNIDNTQTVNQTEEKKEIIFDLTLPPNQQKNLRNHTEEYMQQVYKYLFPDTKVRNMIKDISLSYSELKERGNVENFYDWVSSWADEGEVFGYVFTENNDFRIPLKDLPVTANYIVNHPKPLRQEFKDVFKDDYEITSKDGKYIYSYGYEYSVSVDKEKKQAVIEVNKSISFSNEEYDVENGALFGKPGSKYEGQELYDTLRKIYFDYTLDEKGYLDDIKYSHTQIINDENELDASCPEYQ